MANFDLTQTGQVVQDDLDAVDNSGSNAANKLAHLGTIDVATPGTVEVSKALIVDGSKALDVLEVASLTSNSNRTVEGLSTGRNVLRAMAFIFAPGSIPNTNINITQSVASFGFNLPTVTNASDLTAGGTSGSWSLSADGTIITLDLTEVVVGALGISPTIVNINNSSATESYVFRPNIVGGNLTFEIRQTGGITELDWRTILDAGDLLYLLTQFVTSS